MAKRVEKTLIDFYDIKISLFVFNFHLKIKQITLISYI